MTAAAAAARVLAVPSCLALLAAAYRESGGPELWSLDGFERAAGVDGAAGSEPAESQGRPAAAEEKQRPVALELRSSGGLNRKRGARSSSAAATPILPQVTQRSGAGQANRTAASLFDGVGTAPTALTVPDLLALRDRSYNELKQAFTVLSTAVLAENMYRLSHVQDKIRSATQDEVFVLKSATERFSRRQQRLMAGARHGVSGMCCCKQPQAAAAEAGFGGASCQWIDRGSLHGGRRDKCPPGGADALPWDYIDVRSPGGGVPVAAQVGQLLDECINSTKWEAYLGSRSGN